MNKADVVRFELEQAENRVELCKVSHILRYLYVARRDLCSCSAFVYPK